MNQYDFNSLNDKEFEQIVRDLLNAKFKFEVQDFKTGKDGGVDLRYSSPDSNNQLVVQVKHYLNSGFAQLKSALIHDEWPKVSILKPKRYIVASSLSLSAKQKDTIKDVMKPYILTSNDVIGREDLNSYLAEFPAIEKRYMKLWLSSVNILNSILYSSSKWILPRIFAVDRVTD